MAQLTNKDKLLQAVLLNEELIKFGKYSLAEIGTLYQALDSDNCVINVVAQIINRTEEGASESVLWKEINEYLKRNI